MWKIVQECLQRYKLEKGPLLLGYSGGVDSAALLALLRLGTAELHVLHIHHSWRREALKEAFQLGEYVRSLGLPFYMESITSIDPEMEGNIEDKYRIERRKIFQKYYKLTCAKALVLAHQQDDQAETVFKRVFEGASLGKLTGLREYAELDGMIVVRPLLTLSKEKLYSFLKKNQLSYLEDSTNKDVRYLRGRQREKIFPEIEKAFGKRASRNLCRLADELSEYATYMTKRVDSYYKALSQGPWGYYLDLGRLPYIEPFELAYFVRQMCASLQVVISYEGLKTLVKNILLKKSDKKIIAQSIEIHLDRNKLFFLRSIKQAEKLVIQSIPCTFVYQGLSWKLEQVEHRNLSRGWEDLWKGSVEFAAFPDLEMTFSNSVAKIGHTSIKEMYQEQKIPVPLRGKFFQLFQNQQLCFDPLLPICDKRCCGQKIFRLSMIDSI